MLMTQSEKLDMLMHQLVEEEAQMMAFLIEQEYGAEINLQVNQQSLQMDEFLEKGLEHQMFRKYLTFARLQATIQARKYTEDHLQAAKDQD